MQENQHMTIKLQGIHGEQPAKHVKDLCIGDIIKWNFGYTSTVVELVPSKTGKMILCKLLANGIIYDRRLGADRLVAIG